MKLLKYLALFAVFCFLANLPGQSLAAGKMQTAKVAILNYQLLMRESLAAKQIRADIEKLRAQYKKSFQKLERKLSADRRKLIASKSSLTEEVFDKKRRAFEKQLILAQRTAQDRVRQLDRIFAAAMAKVQAAIVPVVKQHTVRLDVNLVVDSTQVFFAAKTLNITKSVLAGLNRKLKRVPVKAPSK